ncbi:MAG TPA: glycosyltransferase family 4 protein [Anaerolineaceae bacterium]|nr:glycosyltransferase family 4 protein [Anaerolineaceae bacterium]
MSRNLKVVLMGAYPMDIAHINGGVQAAFAYLVKGLAQTRELDLHILTPSPTPSPRNDMISQPNLTIHFLTHYPRFERLRNYKNYQGIVNKKISEIQPDLIHAQDAGSDALVALRTEIPTVITIHGIRWEDGKHYSSLIKRFRMYYDSLITERYVVHNAQHLIAISPYVTRYFNGKLKTNVQTYYVPNAIDERYFNQEKNADEKIVLFAGRVIPRKRVFDLVQAFAQVSQQVPSARLIIAGEIHSEPAYVETIKKWIHLNNLDKQIIFAGSLSEEEIIHEFALCSMLVLPSAQETAPMVIAQAMAAGKPVVATRVGGVVDMVGANSERGLLVNVGDIKDLATAITRLLLEPGLKEKMGKNGREFAQENYHLDQIALKTIEIYHQITLKEQYVYV